MLGCYFCPFKHNDPFLAYVQDQVGGRIWAAGHCVLTSDSVDKHQEGATHAWPYFREKVALRWDPGLEAEFSWLVFSQNGFQAEG